MKGLILGADRRDSEVQGAQNSGEPVHRPRLLLQMASSRDLVQDVELVRGLAETILGEEKDLVFC